MDDVDRYSTRWRPALELALMVLVLQLDSWWADTYPSELPSNVLKAFVPVIWWVSFERRRRRGITLPPPRVGRGRAWLEAGAVTLIAAALMLLAGTLLREPYDAVRYPSDETLSNQINWISSRLGRALFQQGGLQIFVWPVARELVGKGPRAVTLAAGVFAFLHVPYPLLVLTTFVLAWIWVALFRRGRSLSAMVVSHAVLAMIVFAAVPDWVSHNLHVGRSEVTLAPVYRQLARSEVRDALREVTTEEYYLHQGGDDRAWVEAVFQDLLDRRPTSGEIADWTERLSRSPRSDVAKKLVVQVAPSAGESALP